MKIQTEHKQTATNKLNNIRLGQPEKELIETLSPESIIAKDYLATLFKQRQPLVKMISGDMGSGKTTLKQLFSETATVAGATVIKIDLSYTPTSRMKDAITTLLCHPPLYESSIEYIRKCARSGNDTEIERIIANTDKAFHNVKLQNVFRKLIETVAEASKPTDEEQPVDDSRQPDPDILSAWLSRSAQPLPLDTPAKISHALNVWISDNRLTPLKDLFKTLSGEKGDWQTIGAPYNEELTGIFQAILGFFKACNTYPVWMIDEFESIIGFRAEGRGSHLGMYRDIIDDIYRYSWGGIMLYSTPDGVQAILQYPALYDRLQGTEDFLLTSPTWQTKHFSQWSASAVTKLFRNLYLKAAAEGDYISNKVVDHIKELDSKNFAIFMDEINQAPNIPPRLKLKEVIFTIDRLAQNPEHFESLKHSAIDHQDSKSAEDEGIAKHQEREGANTTPQNPIEPVRARDNDTQDHDDTPDHETNENMAAGDDHHTDDIGQGGIDSDLDIDSDLKVDDEIIAYRDRHISKIDRKTLITYLKKTKEPKPKSLAAYLSAFRDAGGSTKELFKGTGTPKGYRLALNENDPTLTDLITSIEQQTWTPTLEWVRQSFISARNDIPHPTDNPELQLFVKKRIKETNPEYVKYTEKLERGEIDESEEKPPKPFRYSHENRLINPFSTIGDLRHFIYTALAHEGAIPSDKLVDRSVRHIVESMFGYTLRTSRNGIAFSDTEGMPRLWARTTYYADETIPKAVEPEIE